MKDILSALAVLGFSKAEAAAYDALVRHGKMNGYQLAKYLKISRPGAYDALESLLSKGYVYLLQGSSREFAPKDPSELFARMKKDFCGTADRAAAELIRAADRSHEKLFMNIEGLAQITAKVSSLIGSAKEEVLISGDFDLRPLEAEIRAAHHRGVRIIVFSFIDPLLDGFPVEVCSPRHPDNPECMDRRIMIVADFERSLIASSQGSIEWNGTFSENTLLSKIVSEHIHHDIYLLRLRGKKGKDIIDASIKLSSLMERGKG